MSPEARVFDSVVRSCKDYDQHEQVVLIHDKPTGLHCLIAVHNTHRGPGVGGCRLWRYDNEVAALTDVLRLSRGMTYKNAMADLPFGGGKAVILAPDFSRVNRQDLFRAFGRAVERVDGAYCTAEDVGTSPHDMATVSQTTKHIFGLSHTSGDPSPYTAYGVFLGIKEAVKHRLSTDSLCGVRIAVQGLGHVGYSLCEQLHAAGAELAVSDVRPKTVVQCKDRFGAESVSPEDIYDVNADVYAPCALGATINEDTLRRLKVSVIAGAANNQLSQEHMAEIAVNNHILYAPDYVINAGGIVNIACERGIYNPVHAKSEVEKIANRLSHIFKSADAQSTTTLDVANDMARKKFCHGKSTHVDVETLTALAPA